MMARGKAPRGIVNTALPFRFSVHVDIILASSKFLTTCFALALPSAQASRISLQLVGSGTAGGENSRESSMAALAMRPGATAMCMASCPSEYAFGCGFQASLLSGTRSRTRCVVFSSISISISIASAIAMTPPFSNVFATCRLELRARNCFRKPAPSLLNETRQLLEAPAPAVRVLVALLRVRQLHVRQQDLRGRAEVEKFDGDERLARGRVFFPAPCEHNLFGRLDLAVRSGHDVDVAALVVHFHFVVSADFQIQFGNLRGIVGGRREPAREFLRVRPGAEYAIARRLKGSSNRQRGVGRELLFGHQDSSIFCWAR